jgi:hypothetical protein
VIFLFAFSGAPSASEDLLWVILIPWALFKVRWRVYFGWQVDEDYKFTLRTNKNSSSDPLFISVLHRKEVNLLYIQQFSFWLKHYFSLQTSKPAFYWVLIIFKPLTESQIFFFLLSASICAVNHDYKLLRGHPRFVTRAQPDIYKKACTIQIPEHLLCPTFQLWLKDCSHKLNPTFIN